MSVAQKVPSIAVCRRSKNAMNSRTLSRTAFQVETTRIGPKKVVSKSNHRLMPSSPKA